MCIVIIISRLWLLIYHFTSFHNKRSVRSDEHGHCSSTASGSSRPRGIHRNVSSHHQRKATCDGKTEQNKSSTPLPETCCTTLTVPSAALHPRHGVEESLSPSIAGVGSIDALNAAVAMLVKELHQNSLHRL